MLFTDRYSGEIRHVVGCSGSPFFKNNCIGGSGSCDACDANIQTLTLNQTNTNTKPERIAMPQENNIPKPERIPFFQRMLDNPFLLLFIGVVMPTVFYILWGVMEIATIPVAP